MNTAKSARRSALALLILAFCAPADARAPAIAVHDGWTRPTSAGMNAAGYLTIANTGKSADRLVSAASQAAASVTLHETRSVGGVSTMRAMDGLPIRPGATVALAPGGYHLMLERLKKPIKVGDRVVVILTFFKAGQIPTTLAVRAAAPEPAMGDMKM